MITAASIADIIGAIHHDLTEWTGQNAGTCHLAKDIFDFIESLGRRPETWGVTVHWEGDAPADPRVRDVAVVDNRIRLIVDGQLAPTAQRNIELIRTTGRRLPMLKLMEAVRDRVMAYRFAWLAEPNNRLRYLGADDKVPLPDGQLIAAYNLSFGLYHPINTPEVKELSL